MEDKNIVNISEIISKNSKELHIPSESYLRIVNSSFGQTELDIETLAKAIDSNDYETIKMIAHRGKGVYANLRLDMLSIPFTQMDELAKTMGDISEFKEIFMRIREGLEKIKNEFL